MLKGKTVFITGGSRGIGRAIALRLAKDGANVTIAAKTDKPHPKLEGTIFSVADEIEAAGGRALPLKVDVRDDKAIEQAISETVSTFGGIDILVNNASALSLTDTLSTSIKRYDLMMSVNMRATFIASRAAIPYLEDAENPHILMLSPPLSLDPKWFSSHLAYTMSKYGMSMCVLGLSEELKHKGIKVNALWPKTTISTAAVKVHFPDVVYQGSRHPEIMADAAYYLFCQQDSRFNGQFFIDETLLQQAGVNDLSNYAINPEVPLFSDLFINER